MTEVDANLSHLAEEYRELPSSLENFLDSIEEFVRSVDNTFEPSQLSNVNSFVDAYEKMGRDVQVLESESQKLLEYLEGNREPSDPDDIDDINRAVHSLIDSVEEFTNQAEQIRSEFIELGLAEQAEALQDVTTQFSQLPAAIRSSLLDNQLLFVLKAQYFPAAASEEISDHMDRLDAMDPQGRQNTYGAIALAASASPEAGLAEVTFGITLLILVVSAVHLYLSELKEKRSDVDILTQESGRVHSLEGVEHGGLVGPI